MDRHPMDGLSRTILDIMAQAVFVKNRAGVVIYGNPAYAALLGSPLERLVDRHDGELFPPEDVRAYEESDRLVLDSGARLVREYRLVTFAGREIPVITTKARLTDATGEAYVLGTITDISAQAAQEAALARALDDARAAEEGRAAFLANISHGIRTPMNGVLGMLAVLRATPLTPRQVAITEVIRQSGEHLMRVLGDLITYASLEAGRLRLAAVPFVPAELARRLAQAHGLRVRARGLGFAAEIAPGAEAPVLGDPDRLAEVIERLLDNALAFTTAGQIGLSLAQEAAGPGRARLRVAVRDTGPGLRAGGGESPFDAALRFSPDHSDPRAGVGLGLVICRRLMSRMGGEIALSARPEGGTLVTLDLVLPCAPDPRPGQAA